MLNILIVDDTRSVHAFIRDLLKPWFNLRLTSALDGADAVALVKSGASFDLVMLDWEMPILNGPQTLEAFKDLGLQSPILMMTTKNQMSDIEQMLKAGVAEYMMKPFTQDILLQKMELALGRQVADAA